MKKVVFASLMVLTSVSLVVVPSRQAQASGAQAPATAASGQDSSTIQIKDPAEYNAYQTAITQSDPKAEAAALEDFLKNYPQSVVKKAVLEVLVDTYQKLQDPDKELTATSRVLQIEPNNEQAIFLSVYIKKGQCAKTSDAQTCDDAATLAQKGLTVAKPDATSADDWKKATATYYPVFHSTIALDDALSKKDFKATEAEYTAELMLFSDDQSKSAGLADTYQLAESYVQPGDGQDVVKAIYLYARAVDFAPANYKGPIEKKLEYWYKKYHGKLDGLDDVKTKAAATTFPPADFKIAPAPTPAEQIHTMLTDPSTNLASLALSDKETILALGSKDDAEKIWAVMKDQQTPVPGTVIEATATVIKVAVTDDSKLAKVPDFIVTLKTALPEKEIPQPGFEFGLASKGQAELDGTYDSYTQVPPKAATPATATTPAAAATEAAAQIMLRDGSIQPVKKTAPHKPTATHRPAAH
jgi:tetratricopeptide (TPR) repeat protein